jgi:hypothetical protein
LSIQKSLQLSRTQVSKEIDFVDNVIGMGRIHGPLPGAG